MFSQRVDENLECGFQKNLVIYDIRVPNAITGVRDHVNSELQWVIKKLDR